MAKKYSIYTVVIDNYDRPKSPPPLIAQEIDFFLVSNQDITIRGWQSIKISGEPNQDPVSLSRQLKMLYFTEFQESCASLYLDGNISPNGYVIDLFEKFERSGRPIGLFPHPKRNSVQEEAEHCLKVGKISSRRATQLELESYGSEGFRDGVGLFHGGVIFRRLDSRLSRVAMENWNKRYDHWRSRDQLSLPVSLWSSGIEPYVFEPVRRPLDKYFYFYSHKGSGGKNRIVGAIKRGIQSFRNSRWFSAH